MRVGGMKKTVLLFLIIFISTYGASIVQTINAPANNIVGLAVDPAGSNNILWAVSKSEEKVYKLNATSGEVLSSFTCAADTLNMKPAALAFAGGLLYVAQWDGSIYNGWGYEYTPEGVYKGRTSIFC